MVEVTSSSSLAESVEESGNRFVGEVPAMANSKIVFKGKGNILYCEEGVRLSGSRIAFNGDNSLVYLRRSKDALMLGIDMYNANVFVMGIDCYTNGVFHAILSEGRHVFVGDHALLSFGIWVRTADPHLVYDVETHQRINPSRHVFIGDHVWIGQSAFILKGTIIGSGSIVGAASVVTGKKIPSNASWGGNPARSIRNGVFWNGSCVHAWGPKQTKARAVDSGEGSIFKNDPNEVVDVNDFLIKLDELDMVAARFEYLKEHFARHSGGSRYFIPVEGEEEGDKASGSVKKSLFGRRK
ncbi:hypothetical protein GMI70_10005 [Eggerthellaceae bacterium zg-893]|nr:hypothetical protein [Eggerthellaceae bacterium zg-893]